MRRVAVIPMLMCLTASVAWAQAPKMSTSPEAEAAYAEMKQMLGFVPGFMQAFPQSALPGAWEVFKNVQLSPQTALSGKNKELIGLAVAAQVPCTYCVYAHTEFAKLNGATDEEIKTATAQASLTRFLSTWLNGVMPEESVFKAEIGKLAAHLKNAKPMAAPAMPMAPVTTAQGAYAEMQGAFGVVPGFFKMLPEAAVPGVWREMKGLQMNASGLSGKDTALIGLSVASQIPCRYCVIAETELSKLSGATEREQHEAILMAALTRHWSTFLHGVQIDEKAFRKDIDKLVAGAKKQMAAMKSASR